METITNLKGNMKNDRSMELNCMDDSDEMLDEFSVNKVKIQVIGIGGGGTNSINRTMINGLLNEEKLKDSHIEVWALNTDAQDLNKKTTNHQGLRIPYLKRMLLGKESQRGMGTGGDPEIGKCCAEEDRARIIENFNGTDIAIITASLGGGTGSGAAPKIAEYLKQVKGSFGKPPIVISIATLPFSAEGSSRDVALEAYEQLNKHCDTVILIQNDEITKKFGKMFIQNAFKNVDVIISKFIQGITDTLSHVGVINIDFADMERILEHGGMSVIGVGCGKGHNRLEDAINESFNNVLFDVDYKAAGAVLINVIGGYDLKLKEAIDAGEKIVKRAKGSVDIIWGVTLDERYQDRVDIITAFTGVTPPSHIANKTPKESISNPQSWNIC